MIALISCGNFSCSTKPPCLNHGPGRCVLTNVLVFTEFSGLERGNTESDIGLWKAKVFFLEPVIGSDAIGAHFQRLTARDAKDNDNAIYSEQEWLFQDYLPSPRMY